MHLGSQLFALEPYRRAIAALATLGDFGTYDLGGGLGVPYTSGDPALDVETWVHGMVEAAHAELGPDRTLVLEPGRALVAGAGVTLYTRRVGQAGRRRRAAGRRRRRDVRQPAPDALRRRLRGARRHAHGRGGRRLHRGRQALRVRRRAGARRAACPTRGPATWSSRPRPAPTATRWPTTTTASRGRRSCSAPAGARAWSCAGRPTRSCMGETFKVGLLGHGTVGAAFEALLAERADAVAATTGPEARAERRAHPLARRLRGDPRGLGPDRRADRRHRAGARLRAAGDARRQARRVGQQAAALPARRGAVGVRARAPASSCASRARWPAWCRSSA